MEHNYKHELQGLLARLPQVLKEHKGSGPQRSRVAEQIHGLAEKHMSPGQIAQRLGCDRAYVYRVLRRERKAVGQ